VKTTDLWFAAYLYNINPHKLVGVGKTGAKTHFEFAYNAKEWKEYKLEFLTSEVSNVKYIIEKLKDLAFQ
jgi:hypothetical protein